MNPSTPNPTNSNNAGEFHSRDCVYIIDDQPGDNTVRPASGAALKALLAEREKLRKYGFNLDGTPIDPPQAK
jgi:hypothetical protein